MMVMPSLRHPDTYVVIPLYNEQTVIAEVVSELHESFSHVVCVDDGSTDDSVAAARAAGATVVCHIINLGQGAALQTGITYALRQGASYIVMFDADGQHRVIDATAMVQRAKDHDLAVVYGSRFLGEQVETGWLKAVVLKVAAWVTRRSTGLRLTDAHNGLRVLRADAAAQIDLKQNRMAHASEIVVQLAHTQLPWAEHPVQVRYTEYSKAKGQSLLNSVNILVDLIFK